MAIVLYRCPSEHDYSIQTLHRLAGPMNQPFSTKAQGSLGARIKDPTGLIYIGVRHVRTPPNLPVPSLTFCVASQRITRRFAIAARGSMSIDAAALGARANLGLIQWACSVYMDGYVLMCSLYGVQLTFLMNRPYDPVGSTYVAGTGTSEMSRSVGTPSCNVICKYVEHGHWSPRGKEPGMI